VATPVALHGPLAVGAGWHGGAAHARGARLEIIDVPNGQHAFDILNHTDESRRAVERAIDMVLTFVT
jgi:hypothetical protein